MKNFTCLFGLLLTLIISLGFIGCGSGDATTVSIEDAYKQFTEPMCTKKVSCQLEDDEDKVTKEECVAGMNDKISSFKTFCSNTEINKSDLDACVNCYNTGTCEELFPEEGEEDKCEIYCERLCELKPGDDDE